MIKDCVSCIHQRVCQHKELNPKFKEEMRGLIKKWGNIYSEDCPEWHQNPHYHDIGYRIGDNDDKLKTDCRTWNEQERIQPWVKRLKDGELPPKITYNDKVDLDKPKFKEIPMPNVKPCKEESKPSKTSGIDILSKALEGFSENGIINYNTMEDLLNTCDRELIALLADENTFVQRANELLKKKKALQDEIKVKNDNKNIPDYDFSHTFTKTDESKEEYDFVKELEKALGFQIRMDGIRKL